MYIYGCDWIAIEFIAEDVEVSTESSLTIASLEKEGMNVKMSP